MKHSTFFFLTSIFAIFLGSQVTEGWLLAPYWQTLSSVEFYQYYAQWGVKIGKFYTVLTIVAALIPIGTSLHCFLVRSNALKYALLASFFTFLFVALFYIYFKDANQHFLEAGFSPRQLVSELETWEKWHWARVIFEFLSLVFLIFAFATLADEKNRLRSKQIN